MPNTDENVHKLSSISRRAFMGSAAALTGSMLFSQASRAAERPPNIVLIMADDMGYECLGCNGSASYSTPFLDGLAAEGTRFTQCYSYPLCTPSRLAIMTGQHNHRNYEAFGHLSPKEKTFGHMLKDAGYGTCAAGKWQLWGRHDEWVGKGSTPAQAGFDDWCLWQIEDRGSRYANPVIDQKGEGLRTLDGEYGPDVFVNYINDYISDHQDDPFFVYFPMCLTHNPFVPTPWSRNWLEDWDKEHNRYFGDMVTYTDDCVRRIVEHLDALGLRENTLVMFTGDNGTNRRIKSVMQDGRVIRGDKGQPTDAGTHVPFVVNQPGVVAAGQVCDDLISFVDFLPTLAEAAGADPPEGEPMDGVSFMPQLRGEEGDPREALYWSYEPHWGKWERSVFARTHTHKLYEDGRFYNIVEDPLEESPLTVDTVSGEAAENLKILRETLARFAA